MTYPKKELTVACSYLLRLMKAHVELSSEQINIFKRTFHDILSKRYVGHWFPATPHRGSAYRCLQTKNWKDPVLRSIAERCRLPLHRYLPAIFTIWIDPGEVAVCFGDEGTWCPLYKDNLDGQIDQTYSDGEETVSSLSSDEDLLCLTQNVQTMNIEETKTIPSTTNTRPTVDSRSSSSLASSSRASSPYLNSIAANNVQNPISMVNEYHYPVGPNMYTCQAASSDWNDLSSHYWNQQQSLIMSDNFLSYHQREHC